MMSVGVGCYCSGLPLQLGIAETNSGEGGSEVQLWSHGWRIVGLALSERLRTCTCHLRYRYRTRILCFLIDIQG